LSRIEQSENRGRDFSGVTSVKQPVDLCERLRRIEAVECGIAGHLADGGHGGELLGPGDRDGGTWLAVTAVRDAVVRLPKLFG
jgi:hypothetical protein